MMLKFGLGPKIVTYFLVIGIIPLILFSALSLYNMENALEEEIKNNLIQSIGSATTGLIEYIRTIFTASTSLGSDQRIITNLEDETYSQLNSYLDSQLMKDSILNITSNIKSDVQVIFVTNMQGIVVASTDKILIGKDLSNQDYFINSTATGRLASGNDEDRMLPYSYAPFVIGMPIEGDSGNLLGVVASVYAIEGLQDSMIGLTARNLLKDGAQTPEVLNNLEPGGNVEIYLVDDDREMSVPPLQLKDQGRESLSIMVDTVPVMECLDNKRSFAGTYNNYNDVNVYGVAYCGETGTSVFLAEIPTDIAFAPVKKLRTELAIGGLIIIALVILFGFFAGRSIYKPLNNMTKTINDISTGKLDVQIEGKNRKDEIGELANAFERTVVSLKLAMKKQGIMEQLSKSDKISGNDASKS